MAFFLCVLAPRRLCFKSHFNLLNFVGNPISRPQTRSFKTREQRSCFTLPRLRVGLSFGAVTALPRRCLTNKRKVIEEALAQAKTVRVSNVADPTHDPLSDLGSVQFASLEFQLHFSQPPLHSLDVLSANKSVVRKDAKSKESVSILGS